MRKMVTATATTATKLQFPSEIVQFTSMLFVAINTPRLTVLCRSSYSAYLQQYPYIAHFEHHRLITCVSRIALGLPLELGPCCLTKITYGFREQSLLVMSLSVPLSMGIKGHILSMVLKMNNKRNLVCGFLSERGPAGEGKTYHRLTGLKKRSTRKAGST
jgi:hypothetical protein